jgi:hypothetical protein
VTHFQILASIIAEVTALLKKVRASNLVTSSSVFNDVKVSVLKGNLANSCIFVKFCLLIGIRPRQNLHPNAEI